MSSILEFLTRKRGKKKLNFTDFLSYLYLFLGVIIMFGPIVWLLLSSFKSGIEINRFPPRFFPYQQRTVEVDGYDEPLQLFEVTFEDGTTRELAQVRRVGIEAQLIDPENPEELIKVNIDAREPAESISFNLNNYTTGISSFNFGRYMWNSVVVTISATLLTLIVNSMAAFALAKYKFPGRQTIFLSMIATLMVPLSVVLVPIFLVITKVGWNNNLLGIIVPVAATPTGVFLLRQYIQPIKINPALVGILWNVFL